MKKLTALLRNAKNSIDQTWINHKLASTYTRKNIARISPFLKVMCFLFTILGTTVSGFSQQNNKKDKDLVLEKVNQFFKALETQDTTLFKSIILPGGQTWAVKETGDSVRISMRSFEDRIRKFINPAEVIQERALDATIKVHKQVAMAWVPYELDISGKFAHCGMDIFTLVKDKEGWKIVTVAFTMEPDGCDDLKIKN